MSDLKRDEVLQIYKQLGIENVSKVNTTLATERPNGNFTTKSTVHKGQPLKKNVKIYT